MTEREMNNELRDKAIAHLTDARRHFAQQQEVEPVAYISHTSDGDILGWERQFDAPSHAPLYLHPPKPAALPQAHESLARQFHEAYERLAPKFGYETREDTKQFDPLSNNGRLMMAVCAEIITAAKDEL